MENALAYISSIGKISVYSFIVLAVFLSTVNSKNKLSNRIFAAYLLVIAFDFTGFFIDLRSHYPLLESLKTASSLLQLPLYYCYVLAACYTNFKLVHKHVFHAFPFVVFVFTFGVFGYQSNILLTYEIVGELQFVAYIIAVFVILKKYKKVALENYSNTHLPVYRWLFQITLFSCIAHFFVVIRWWLSNSVYYNYTLYINIVISSCVLAITLFFVMKALYQPQLFTGIDIHLQPLPKKQKIKKSKDSHNLNLQLLLTFMEQKKPYLDFDLSLQKLAVQTDIPEKELSVLLNHEIEQHFFDFINTYRIEAAKQILKDPNKREVTVLEILYEVGFNSKSSFYTAFKKATQLTPSAFRKQSLT
ncbi:MAG: helix-turn-helix domain-containing protein [Flavicella sp.]